MTTVSAAARVGRRHNAALLTSVLLVLPLWAAGARALPAQTTTGSLQGRIVTAAGEAIDQASVSARSTHLQGERVALTDDDGFFQLLALPPGTYEVRATRIGLRTVVIRDVEVRLGGTTNVGELRLEIEPIELDELVVRGRSVTIDPVHTTVGATLEIEDYELLPSDRDYKSLITVLPHITESYRGDVPNVGGQTGPESSYFIDGMNVSLPLLGGAVSTRLPYNFIRAVEVKSGGYEAQYGKALGAVVNAVTYSGTNQREMSFFGFATNSALAAASKAQPTFRTESFLSYDVGARVSGPILHDRLWYSAAYNPSVQKSEKEIEGQGLFEDRRVSHLFAGKLTWQAAPGVGIELSVLGDPTSHEQIAVPHPQLEGLTPTEADPYLTRLETGGVMGSLHATAMLGTRWLLEGSLAASGFRDHATPTTGTDEELFADLVTGTVRGGPFRTYTEDSRRLSAMARATVTLDRHTLLVGAEYEDMSIDQNTRLALIRRDAVDQYLEWREGTSGTTGSDVPTAYAQDAWRVTERLTLNSGLRWSRQTLIGQGGNEAQRFTNEWQPRLGFVLRLGRDGTQRIFGSWGRFYQNEPGNLPAIWYKDYSGVINVCNGDPRTGGATCAKVTDMGWTSEDHAHRPGHLEIDNLDELTLGYEASLGNAATFGVRGIRRDLRSAFGWGWYYDPYFRPDSVVMYAALGSFGEGDLDFLPAPKREYTALELSLQGRKESLSYRASYVLSRSWGNYAGFFNADGGAVNPGGNGMFMAAQQAANNTGLLPNDRTHVLKAATSYATRFGLAAGAFLTWQSGSPLNEFGAVAPSGRGNLWRSFLVPRGTAGRSSSLWNLDLRLAWDAPCPGDRACRLIMDALHVGNPQRPAWLDEFHYFDMDENGNQINENPTYMQPRTYQPPMMIRLGFEVGG